MRKSKPLSKQDASGESFVQEMLDGDPTYAINFDRLQFDKIINKYVIFEFLLCEEEQLVSPYTSHPNRYWFKNARKFISLWEAAIKLEADLYLINYAKVGTKHENEVLAIKVLSVDENGIKKEIRKKFSRQEFKTWFQNKNNNCASK